MTNKLDYSNKCVAVRNEKSLRAAFGHSLIWSRRARATTKMDVICRLFDSPRRFFSSLGSMSDSDEERGPASSLRRAVEASRNADHPSSLFERASRRLAVEIS